MSVDQHPFDLIPAYALGILEEEEQRLVQAHLEGCGTCREDLRAYALVVEDLPLAARTVEPPPQLKEKILRRAGQSFASAPQPGDVDQPAGVPLREGRLPDQAKPGIWQAVKEILSFKTPAWGIASLVLVVLLGASNLLLWQNLNQVESQYQEMANQYENTLRTVPMMGTEFTPTATGLLVISKDGEHGTLVVDRLPVLDESQQYQVWLIRDGQRTSGGVFSVDKYGYGAKWISSPEPLASYPAFGVTIEPAGGSPGPTGERVLGGEL